MSEKGRVNIVNNKFQFFEDGRVELCYHPKELFVEPEKPVKNKGKGGYALLKYVKVGHKCDSCHEKDRKLSPLKSLPLLSMLLSDSIVLSYCQ